MIQKEDLIAARDKMQAALEPAIKEFRTAKEIHDRVCKEIQQPFLELIEKYYDENLVDSSGNPIKIGFTITAKVANKYKYHVVERGMQFVFGEMLFNPRVKVVKINSDGTVNPNAKKIDIFPSELANYVICNTKD